MNLRNYKKIFILAKAVRRSLPSRKARINVGWTTTGFAIILRSFSERRNLKQRQIIF
jgi:hypothetical protein